MPTTIFDSLDEVPEALKAKTTEVDGKFHVDASGLLDNYQAALAEKKAADKARKELEAKLKLFDGLDIEAAKTAIADRQKAEEELLKKQGDWDKMKAQVVAEIESKQIKPLADKAEKLERSLAKALVSDRIRAAVEKAKGKPQSADVLLPHAAAKVRMIEENGDYVARVYDGDTPRVNAKGEYVSFEEFIEKDFRGHDAFGLLFEPSGTTGGGTSPGGTNNGRSAGAKTITRQNFNSLSPREQMDFSKSGGAITD